jgi:type II secretory pathway predicted ATPase ExeA
VDVDGYYIDTAFARRLQAVLDAAGAARTSHVVAALSGAGKSTLLDELRARRPIVRLHDGTTRAPLLVGQPGGDTAVSTRRFARSFLDGSGALPRTTEALEEDELVRRIATGGTGLLVVDEIHTARVIDLQFVKRLMNRVKAATGRDLAVVLLGTGSATRFPLAEVINRPTEEWVQFRRRLSPTEPFVHVAGLSEDEVGEVLEAYEAVLRERFPGLRLARWTGRVAGHLRHPFFLQDPGVLPDEPPRVTTQNVRNVVDGVARRLAARGLRDVDAGGRLIDEAVAAMLGSPDVRVRADRIPPAAEPGAAASEGTDPGGLLAPTA